VSVIPHDFLKTVTKQYNVSKAEFEALEMAIEGQSVEAIAQNLGIRDIAVRKRLGEVYKKLDIQGGTGTKKLARLQQKLISLYNEQLPQQNINRLSSSIVQSYGSEMLIDRPLLHWGDAPDVTVFYGRAEELEILQHWILDDRCRLIAITGMGGIGKTTLTTRLAKQIQGEFEVLIWQSLRNAPSIDQLLDSLVSQLPRQPERININIENKLTKLLDILSKHRCLLILDNFESILSSGDFAGHYPKEWKEYGQLLKRVGEEPHKSCLLLTSLEKPREIAFQEGAASPVRSLPVHDLQKEAAWEILRAKDLSEPENDEWDRLIHLYRGNPLALKIIAATIKELFEGNVSVFLGQRLTLIVRDIQELIDEQYNRLSPLEQKILLYLAHELEPVSLTTLKEQNIARNLSELLQALESLKKRSLIEHRQGNVVIFEVQDLIKQYYKS
jgi:DNA-binding CsgD family transcriptional regulator